jgi:hypothetical protein
MGACSMHERDGNAYNIRRKLEGKYHLKDPAVDGKIKLKLDL